MKLFVISILLFSLAGNIYSREYTNNELHFQCQKPFGWVEIPTDQIYKFEKNLKFKNNLQSADFHCDGAFCLESSEHYFEYPYILFTHKNLSALKKNYSFQEIANIFAESLNKNIPKEWIDNFNINDLFSNYGINKIIIDKKNHSLYAPLILKIANIGTIKGIVTIFFGKGQFIAFYCYSTQKDYEKYLPSFKIILSTFKFEDNYGFESISSNDFPGDENPDVILLVKGLGVLLIIIFTSFVFGKNTRNKFFNTVVEWERTTKSDTEPKTQEITHSETKEETYTYNQYENIDDINLDYYELDDSNLSEEEKVKLYGKILGLSGISKKSDIAMIYRQLIERYNPDKVSHLGEKFQIYAERKTKDINRAYSFFKQKYNL